MQQRLKEMAGLPLGFLLLRAQTPEAMNDVGKVILKVTRRQRNALLFQDFQIDVLLGRFRCRSFEVLLDE